MERASVYIALYTACTATNQYSKDYGRYAKRQWQRIKDSHDDRDNKG